MTSKMTKAYFLKKSNFGAEENQDPNSVKNLEKYFQRQTKEKGSHTQSAKQNTQRR